MDREPKSPEYQSPSFGVKKSDIDADVIMNALALYLDEAYGEILSEDRALMLLWQCAVQSGFLENTENGWELIKPVHEIGLRFGSKFSIHSKFFIRSQIFGGDDPILYFDFYDNMDDAPNEYYEAQARFNSRIADYFQDRAIAVPLDS